VGWWRGESETTRSVPPVGPVAVPTRTFVGLDARRQVTFLLPGVQRTGTVDRFYGSRLGTPLRIPLGRRWSTFTGIHGAVRGIFAINLALVVVGRRLGHDCRVPRSLAGHAREPVRRR
jgi:hypothetical protein